MIQADADVVVLGAGFSGCLTALILNRIGRRVVVIDRCTHPRFAIGESSTPIANIVLRDLAHRYDLPQLLPLTQYGTWQTSLPQITGGLKRGFSYFQHVPHKHFQSQADHSNELLVTASRDDVHSDTHWLRSDVDAFFADQVSVAGIPLIDATTITQIEENKDWRLEGLRGEEPVHVSADFLIDATGQSALLSRLLGSEVQTPALLTNSRALYGHFRGVKLWHDWLTENGGRTVDYPFCCDNAAQHHILDGGWMWLLRFNNGITSAGLVLDNRRFPLQSQTAPEDEWRDVLNRYPSLAELFSESQRIDPVEGLIRTSRLNRRFANIVGPNWAMLPHTAGFVDPLHSTGIAHALCGIERLTGILERHTETHRRTEALQQYQRAVLGELNLIDKLVYGCYESFGRFRLLVAFSMLYFAAATTYERRRCTQREKFAGDFLCADDAQWQHIVTTALDRLPRETETRQPDQSASRQFEQEIVALIEPYNLVGLCDPAARNMYRHTAVPDMDRP